MEYQLSWLATLIVFIPLTGWIMVSASPLGNGTLYFGLFDWPNLPLFTGMTRAQLHPMHETWETVHVVLAWSAIVLIPLHVGAALYHHFWRGDTVLRRMLPDRMTDLLDKSFELYQRVARLDALKQE